MTLENDELEQRAFGLVALAGAATNNIRQRQSLQRYIDSGDADDVLAYLSDTRETFITNVDRLAKSITCEYQRN